MDKEKRKAEKAKWVWFNVIWQERKTKKPCQNKWELQTQMLGPYCHQRQTAKANSFCAAIALHLAKHAVQKNSLHLGLNPKMILRCPYPIEINDPFKLEGEGISNLMQCRSTIHRERHLRQFRHQAHWLMRNIFPCLFSYILCIGSGILGTRHLKIRYNDTPCTEGNCAT